jgi:hypothetical protein
MNSDFWDGKRWDSDAAFDTVDHEHVSCYRPAPGHMDCALMTVQCRDGTWYVEDGWGDAEGAAGVFNPYDPAGAQPVFHASRREAMSMAVEVIARVCGVPEDSVRTN